MAFLISSFNLQIFMYFIWEGGYYPLPSDFDGFPTTGEGVWSYFFFFFFCKMTANDIEKIT